MSTVYVYSVYCFAMKFLTGFESPAAEYQESLCSLDQLLITRPNSTFFGVATGNSLMGIGIFNGDILIIDRAEPVKNGSVVVVIHSGSFSCRILDTINNRLLSASDEYSPIPIDFNDSFIIEGVVTGLVRNHKFNTDQYVFSR